MIVMNTYIELRGLYHYKKPIAFLVVFVACSFPFIYAEYE